MKIFYKPAFRYLITDLTLLIIWIYVILGWFPLTTNNPFEKYLFPALFYIVSWGLWSYILGRYKPLKTQHYYKSTHKLFYTSILVLLIFHIIIYIYFMNVLSRNVLYAVTIGEFTLNYILLTVYFSYRYANEYNDIVNKTGSNPIDINVGLNEKLLLEISKHFNNNPSLKNLITPENEFDYDHNNVLIYKTTKINQPQESSTNKHNSIIQLEKLNYIKGINTMLSQINTSLPENGTFVCCYETKSTYKKTKLREQKNLIRYSLYSLDFIIKRVIPKLFITRWFYFFFSGCKYRVLSKAEVLGRMYYCGFKVEQEKKIGQLNYVVARKISEPDTIYSKAYGPLIKLRRLGKNSKMINVYKMRTMHPYSEFLQAYIYEKNSLQAGGKFNKDIRITTLGRVMRKFWIDELPMIINLLKGDMKLVGVRPLSAHYFSLYSEELQVKRTKQKPGLLPPFYADMPKSMEEIQASEMKYLNKCETNSVIFTDILYLYLILKNIIINKARSA